MVLFVLVYTLLAAINDTPCFIWVVCNKLNYYCLSTKKKLLVSWQFSGPYGVTKYGSGWRKDVVNQCLEFQVRTWLSSSKITLAFRTIRRSHNWLKRFLHPRSVKYEDQRLMVYSTHPPSDCFFRSDLHSFVRRLQIAKNLKNVAVAGIVKSSLPVLLWEFGSRHHG